MGLLDKLFGRDTPSQEIVGKVDKEGPRNPIDQLGVTGISVEYRSSCESFSAT